MKKSKLKQIIREAIEEIHRDAPNAFRVHVPANVYDGKYYDHRTYGVLVPMTDEVKTEQDAIKFVNSHKSEVLAIGDKAREAGGKRRIKAPASKNMFFKNSYCVKPTTVYQLDDKGVRKSATWPE